jgi:phage-related tail fiber protein
MTAQSHINAIGKAITELEDAAKEARQASKRVVLATNALHDALGAAEAAYIASAAKSGSNVVAFSGGTNKPPVNDPNDPVKP